MAHLLEIVNLGGGFSLMWGLKESEYWVQHIYSSFEFTLALGGSKQCWSPGSKSL